MNKREAEDFITPYLDTRVVTMNIDYETKLMLSLFLSLNDFIQTMRSIDFTLQNIQQTMAYK